MSDPGPPRIGRGIWRGVYSAIVDHPDFQVLTPPARLTLLVCRVGSMNTAASIFRYYRGPLQAQTGLSAEELEAALCELEKKPSPGKPWIIRDDAVLWVRNGLKHDPNLSERHEGHRVAILRAIAALPNTPTVKKFRRYYNLPRGRGEAQGGGGGEAHPEGGGDRKGKDSERKEKKTTPSSTPKGEASPTARPSGGAPSTPSSNGQSSHGQDGEGYRVAAAESDHRRTQHRVALQARGLSRFQADTEAGRIVAFEVQHYRQHGQWPESPAPVITTPRPGEVAT